MADKATVPIIHLEVFLYSLLKILKHKRSFQLSHTNSLIRGSHFTILELLNANKHNVIMSTLSRTSTVTFDHRIMCFFHSKKNFPKLFAIPFRFFRNAIVGNTPKRYVRLYIFKITGYHLLRLTKNIATPLDKKKSIKPNSSLCH